MNAMGDRGTHSAMFCGAAYSVADLHPQTDNVVGHDVLVPSGAGCDSADSLAVVARQWLMREKIHTENSLQRAAVKRNVRSEELTNLRKKQRIIEWLIGRIDNG